MHISEINETMAEQRFIARHGSTKWPISRFAAIVKGEAHVCRNQWTIDLPTLADIIAYQDRGRAAVLENAPHRSVESVAIYDRAARAYIDTAAAPLARTGEPYPAYGEDMANTLRR